MFSYHCWCLRTFWRTFSGRCSLVVKSFASDVFDFHRHCDLEVRYTREGMTDCWVICGQGNRSTVPSCKLGCDCMDSHWYPCHIGDWHVTKNWRSLVSIWDARERSHGVLKSLKSSPVGAAPWQNLTDLDRQTAIRELLMQGGLLSSYLLKYTLHSWASFIKFYLLKQIIKFSYAKVQSFQSFLLFIFYEKKYLL